MRSFAYQLAAGLRSRGHRVHELTAPVVFARLAGGHRGLRKWLGYLDQFVLFPSLLLLRHPRLSSRCLCVFAGQALDSACQEACRPSMHSSHARS